MKDKTIIGLGYMPGNAKAICLKTDSETTLGNTEYTIIADPYSRLFKNKERDLLSLITPYKEIGYEAMAVNVLDADTGLTYAVKYDPDKLRRKPKEYSWSDVRIMVGNNILPIHTVKFEEHKAPTPKPQQHGIIGSTYNPEGLRALDLSTRTWENLGSRKYRVVSEPYAKKFERPKETIFDIGMYWDTEHVWINVMDEITERTYAVQFIPARARKNDDAAKIPSFEEIWCQCMAHKRKREHQNDPVDTSKNPADWECKLNCVSVCFSGLFRLRPSGISRAGSPRKVSKIQRTSSFLE